ncbi:MAG TPA: Gldg family protein [bacterium]
MNRGYRLMLIISLVFIISALAAYLIRPAKWEWIPAGIGLAGFMVAGIKYKHKVLEFLKLRNTIYGTNTVVIIVIVLAMLSMVNFIAYRHPVRVDLTGSGIYTLSEQTATLLKNLKQDLKLIAFAKEGSRAKDEMGDLFRGYQYRSDKVSYEFYDPELNPDMVQKYNITQLNTTIVVSGSNQTKIAETREEALTNAIVKVTRQGKQKIYFTYGHGEGDIDDNEQSTGFGMAARALRDLNYEVEKINLSSQQSVPLDSTAIIIAGPRKPFLRNEIDLLGNYLNSGGKVLALINQDMGKSYDDPTLFQLLAGYGVEIGKDIVIDRELRLFAGPSLGVEPLVLPSGSHAITEPIKGSILFSIARSVDFKSDAADANGISIVKTGKTSWAETDIERLRTKREALEDNMDKKGPVSVAVAVSVKTKGKPDDAKKESRLVVAGDSDFADNRLFNNLFNADFFLNSVNWLAEQTDLISIKPKEREASRIFLTKEQRRWLAASLVVVPLAFFFAGLLTWRRRRRL